MRHLLVVMCILLAGCEAFIVAGELFIRDPEPVPIVCSAKTEGVQNEYGETCRFFTDGKYRWVKNDPYF